METDRIVITIPEILQKKIFLLMNYTEQWQ